METNTESRKPLQAGAVEAGFVVCALFLASKITWTNPLWATQAASRDLDGDAGLLMRDIATGAWRPFTMENRALVANGNPLIWTNLDWELQ